MVCVQLVGALLAGAVVNSPNPSAAIIVASLFFVQSAIVVTLLWRRRSPEQPRLCVLDVSITCIVLLTQPIYANPATSSSTWDAWGYGVSNPTIVLAALAFSQLRHSVLASLFVMSSYMISLLPNALDQGVGATVIVNGIGYVFNVLVCRVVWVFLLRLARSADSARVQAARTARREEQIRAAGARELEAARQDAARAHDRVRYQFMLHDTTGLMENVRRDLERHSLNNGDLASTVARIRALTLQFRALLDGEELGADVSTLGGRLTIVGASFADLNLVTNVAVVEQLLLPARDLDLIEDSVRTLLGNVRLHAKATETVLHATSDESTWSITVRDNGQGWDTSRPMGWGLRRQVVEAMATLGACVDIYSSPEGSAVSIVGPLTIVGGDRL